MAQVYQPRESAPSGLELQTPAAAAEALGFFFNTAKAWWGPGNEQ